jgi:hypothetical protein
MFFSLFVFVELLYLVFHFTIGRLIPGLRSSGGAVILLLSCLPWISVILSPLLYLVSLNR